MAYGRGDWRPSRYFGIGGLDYIYWVWDIRVNGVLWACVASRLTISIIWMVLPDGQGLGYMVMIRYH